MIPEPSRNLAQSIHHRLLNKARERNEDPNLILIRYALERFLYRLGRSIHKGRFILKGAMLFAAWTDQPHRPTRDLDLLGIGDSSDATLTRAFLLEPLHAAARNESLPKSWKPVGPWAWDAR